MAAAVTAARSMRRRARLVAAGGKVGVALLVDRHADRRGREDRHQLAVVDEVGLGRAELAGAGEVAGDARLQRMAADPRPLFRPRTARAASSRGPRTPAGSAAARGERSRGPKGPAAAPECVALCHGPPFYPALLDGGYQRWRAGKKLCPVRLDELCRGSSNRDDETRLPLREQREQVIHERLRPRRRVRPGEARGFKRNLVDVERPRCAAHEFPPHLGRKGFERRELRSEGMDQQHPLRVFSRNRRIAIRRNATTTSSRRAKLPSPRQVQAHWTVGREWPQGPRLVRQRWRLRQTLVQRVSRAWR